MKEESVFIISSEFPPLPGGIGTHAHLLATYLQKNEYAVTVLTNNRTVQTEIQFDAQQDFRVVRVPRNRLTYFNRIKQGFKHTKHNRIIIASGKFSLWLAGLLSVFYTNKKYIAVVHGSELKAGDFLSRQFTKWGLKRFGKLIAVSNYTKKKALEININLKIEVINNGVEYSEIKKIAKKENEKEISLITVGNLTYRKGQHNVIKALPLLIKEFGEVRYHCVGIETQKQQLVALVKKNNVSDKVVFHGMLPTKEKNKLLAESTVFIMLSDEIKNDFEGFGIAVLEANALGVPVIGSKNSGISDAISHKFSGMLVNPHNPQEILEAVQEITSHYETYSQNALTWASNFMWSKVINQYLKVLKTT